MKADSPKTDAGLPGILGYAVRASIHRGHSIAQQVFKMSLVPERIKPDNHPNAKEIGTSIWTGPLRPSVAIAKALSTMMSAPCAVRQKGALVMGAKLQGGPRPDAHLLP